MKKMLAFLIIGLIGYAVFWDLSSGTLQKLDSKQSIPVHESITFETMIVKKGDTVLSVLEKLNGELPVSIEEALDDFKKLNPGTDPMMIHIDETYKFPLYNNEKRSF